MSRCSAATAARFRDARARMNECPLGAAALAGTGFPIDRRRPPRRWASTGRRPTASMRCRTGTSRRSSLARRDLRDASVAPGGRDRDLVDGAVRFRALSDRFSTGSSIMPQKRNPTPPNWCGPRSAASYGSLMALAGDDEGVAAGLFQGHAGGQGAGLRRRRAFPWRWRRWTGMVRDLEPVVKAMRAAAGSAFPRRRISPTGWCASWACRSAMPTTSTGGGAAHHGGGWCSASRIRSLAASAMAARLRRRCARRSRAGGRRRREDTGRHGARSAAACVCRRVLRREGRPGCAIRSGGGRGRRGTVTG
jgi:hypothetical protein